MKIKITEDHDHRPTPASVQAFKEGTEPNVPENTAKALIKAGVAKEIPTKSAGSKKPVEKEE